MYRRLPAVETAWSLMQIQVIAIRTAQPETKSAIEWDCQYLVSEVPVWLSFIGVVMYLKRLL
jgi:hypothetical protein